MVSLLGRLFFNFENKICYNLKIFVGKHEKTIEILFLTLFFFLQGILAFYIFNPIVTLIIIVFLFFLSLERIFVHIWLDYEREKLKIKEDDLRNKYDKLKILALEETSKLKQQILLLKNKR